MAAETMRTERVKIDSLKTDPANLRKHDERQIELVATSLSRYGQQKPIVIGSDSVVIAGHGVLEAARKIGWTHIEAVRSKLKGAERAMYAIADNRLAELSSWDEHALGAVLKELDAADLDSLGFTTTDLAELSCGSEAMQGLSDPDDVPQPPDEATTKPGDLWVLGNHRLLCGDSAEPEEVARLMDGGQADLLLTDPPYNVAYEGGTDAAMTIANDDMDHASYRRFLVATLGSAVAVLRPGGAFYCWHADSEGLTVRGACADIGLTVRQCLIWVKSSLVLGRQDYQWKHEPCLYGWKDGAAHTWLSDRSQTTVLAFDKPARNGEHPTMKPVPLFLSLIQNSCAPAGVVLDPFGGSGTTLIACEQTGRRAFLMELDTLYCDVIVQRWEKFTGQKAVLESTKEKTPAAAGAKE